MDCRHEKEKDKAWTSKPSKKRNKQYDRVPRALVVPRGHVQRFGYKAVTEASKKWYSIHLYTKCIFKVFINNESLQREYPTIVR